MSQKFSKAHVNDWNGHLRFNSVDDSFSDSMIFLAKLQVVRLWGVTFKPGESKGRSSSPQPPKINQGFWMVWLWPLLCQSRVHFCVQAANYCTAMHSPKNKPGIYKGWTIPKAQWALLMDELQCCSLDWTPFDRMLTKVKSKVQNNSFNPRYLAWFAMTRWSMMPNKMTRESFWTSHDAWCCSHVFYFLCIVSYDFLYKMYVHILFWNC